MHLSSFPSLSPTPSALFPKEDFKNNKRGLEENFPFPIKTSSRCGGPRFSVHMCSLALVLVPSWRVHLPPNGFLSGSAQ